MWLGRHRNVVAKRGKEPPGRPKLGGRILLKMENNVKINIQETGWGCGLDLAQKRSK
jgi:hypothetical protein